MAAAGAASIAIMDADTVARARTSHGLHGHKTQVPPNVEIPAGADPRLARAAQHRKTLFGALPEQTQLALLREATPSELRHASGIEWNQVPAMVVGAVLYTPNWPNRWAVLLAAAVLARNGLSRGSIRTANASFKRLALHLHQRFGTNCWIEVTPTQWREVAQDEQLSTATRTTWFEWYQAVSSFHVQEYFEGLSAENQAALTAYAWPRLPARFVDRYVPTRVADNEAQHGARPARTCSCPSRTSLPRWSCDEKRRRSGWSSTSALPWLMWRRVDNSCRSRSSTQT